MKKSSVSSGSKRFIPRFLEARAEHLSAVADTLDALNPEAVEQLRHLGAAGLYGSRVHVIQPEMFVGDGEFDSTILDRTAEDAKTLIINLLPFVNGADEAPTEAFPHGKLSTHMAIRAGAIALATGADVLSVPNNAGFDALNFSKTEKKRIKKGDLSPYSERIQSHMDQLGAYGRVVISGYSQGAVLGEKISGDFPDSDVVCIEPTNVGNTKKLPLAFKYLRIGMKRVRVAARDSGIRVLSVALGKNPKVSPLFRNLFVVDNLLGDDFGTHTDEDSLFAFGFSDSTICDPLNSAKHNVTSLEYGGDGMNLGHVTTDNVLVHAGILAEYERLAQAA